MLSEKSPQSVTILNRILEAWWFCQLYSCFLESSVFPAKVFSEASMIGYNIETQLQVFLQWMHAVSIDIQRSYACAKVQILFGKWHYHTALQSTEYRRKSWFHTFALTKTPLADTPFPQPIVYTLVFI